MTKPLVTSTYLSNPSTLPSSYYINSHYKIIHYKNGELCDLRIRANASIGEIKSNLSSSLVNSLFGITNDMLGPGYWQDYINNEIALGPEECDIYNLLGHHPIMAMGLMLEDDADMRINWERKWNELYGRLNDVRYHNYSNNKNKKGFPSSNFIFIVFWELGNFDNFDWEDNVDNFMESWKVEDMLNGIERKNNKLELLNDILYGIENIDNMRVDILCNKCDISFMNLEFVLIPTILISITSISGESIERNYAITDRFMDGPLDGWSKYVGTCNIEELGCALFSELSERPCGRFKGSIEDYLAKYNKSDMERLNLTIILPSSLDVPDC